MNVTVLYVSGPGTVVGALSQRADPAGAPASPSDLAGSDFPVRTDGTVVSIPVGLLGIASIDPTGTDGVFDDPGCYVIDVTAGSKPKLKCATNPSPSTLALSQASGITISDAKIPDSVSAVVVLQDTTAQAAVHTFKGTTTAGQFQVPTPLAPGPWNVAWFIAGSRPGTAAGITAA